MAGAAPLAAAFKSLREARWSAAGQSGSKAEGNKALGIKASGIEATRQRS